MHRRRFPTLLGAMVVAAALASALVAAGCGGSKSSAEDTGEAGIIRFAFSPDPVWDYLKDSGTLDKMQEQSGITIIQLETSDEFAVFAGGHADIVSTGSYETPLFDQKGIPNVTIGKYNASKDLLVASNPKYKTAADLPKGCKIGAESTIGNTIIWIALIKKLDNRTLAENGSDLQIATADAQVLPDLVASGDLCAAIADPTQATEALRTGKVHAMYDGRSVAQLYADEIQPGSDLHVDTNNFVARKAWYDANPDEVAFFLQVWQKGLDLWAKDPNKIIEAEPNDFSIQNADDMKFMEDYLAQPGKDFFQKNVYLTKGWIDDEKPVFDIVQQAGEYPADQPLNESVVIDPKTGKTTDTIGQTTGG
jgi:ABC-type nitrate/sulfonate/bicarbonate transport system substrate-binding protein